MKNKTFTKKEIIAEIQDAIVKEELAVPLYTSHIEQSLFWSGLDKDKRKKMINGLKLLAKDSKGHALALQKIIDIYNKDKKK